MESFVRRVLVLLWVSFNLSSSSIVTTEGEELANYGRAGGNTIDLTKNGDVAYVFVRTCDWELQDREGDWIVQMTRYCYCTESKSLDPAHRSCSYPGPTLLMHSYTNVTVWLVNELVGNATTIGPLNTDWNSYKDMDTTNLHVHGLHVSPFVDDIIFAKAHPIPYNESFDPFNPDQMHVYEYDVDFHYPGTFWYHAHHHGSTTWQVNQGLHGAILMNPWDDMTFPNGTSETYGIGEYEQTVLMFEWLYTVDTDWCTNDYSGNTSVKCPVRNQNYTTEEGDNGLEELLSSDYSYSSRFTAFTNRNNFSRHGGVTDDFSMCDCYCSMPLGQRWYSGYQYDIQINPQTSDCVYSGAYNATKAKTLDPASNAYTDCMYFFVNGQYKPQLTDVQTDEFRRLRMINSMSNWYLQMQFPDDCSWYLIATDGVYITESDLMNYNLSDTHENQLLMPPGGRADVLFKCDTPGIYNITSTRDASVDTTNQTKHLAPIVYANKTLFSIIVDSSTSDDSTSLPEASDYPPKPDDTYIEDFCNESTTTPTTCGQGSNGTEECHFKFFDGNGPQLINQRKFLENFTLSDLSLIEHRNWSGLVDKFNIGIFEVDSSQEFVINNNNSHVYHQHINPFQVMHNVGGNGFIALKCTWWDSLGNYVNEGAGIGDTVTVKTWTRGHWLASTTETENPFLGKITDCFFGTGGGLVINHCHLLQHEDKGMMGFYGIVNKSRNCLFDDEEASSEDEDGSDSTTEDDSDGTTVVIVIVVVVVLIVVIASGIAYHQYREKSASKAMNEIQMGNNSTMQSQSVGSEEMAGATTAAETETA